MAEQKNRRKIVYIISHIDKAIGFEWITENLDRSNFDLSFILLNDKPSYLANYLRKNNIPVHEIHFTGKWSMPTVLLKVISVLRKIKPDVIHTHMYGADIS